MSAFDLRAPGSATGNPFRQKSTPEPPHTRDSSARVHARVIGGRRRRGEASPFRLPSSMALSLPFPPSLPLPPILFLLEIYVAPFPNIHFFGADSSLSSLAAGCGISSECIEKAAGSGAAAGASSHALVPLPLYCSLQYFAGACSTVSGWIHSLTGQAPVLVYVIGPQSQYQSVDEEHPPSRCRSRNSNKIRRRGRCTAFWTLYLSTAGGHSSRWRSAFSNMFRCYSANG